MAVAMIDGAFDRRCAQAWRANVDVADVVRRGALCLVLQAVVLLCWAMEGTGRTVLAVQASLGMMVREATSAEALKGAAMVVCTHENIQQWVCDCCFSTMSSAKCESSSHP